MVINKLFSKKNLIRFIKPNFLFLYLIIILGAALRFQGVLTNSFAFTYDVGRDMLMLWDIAYNHKLILIGATTGIPGVFYGPWWYYLLTPFYILFRADPRGIALIMSLIGILTIVFMYFLGKKLSGSTFLGLCMAYVAGLSPYLISLSTQIWNPNVAPLFVIFTFLILNKIYISKDKILDRYFILLGLLLALNIDFEIMWGIFFTIGILISLVFISKNFISIRNIMGFLAGLFIVALPRISFEFRHNFIMSKSFVNFITTKSLEDKKDFIQFFLNRFFTYLDEINKTFFQANLIISVLMVIFVCLVVVILYKQMTKPIKNLTITSIIVLICFYIGTFIFRHSLWPHYFVGLPIIYIFLFSVSVYQLSLKIKSKLIPIIILGMLTIIVYGSLNIISLFTGSHWIGDASVYRNQLKVVDYVYNQAKGKDFKYVVYTPPVHDYTYQYLFKWYGPKKYNYSPNNSARLAFFIIEPDPVYPDRITQWLDVRKGDGTIIKQDKTPADIIIQTRIH